MDIETLIERLGENTDCWTDKVHGYADLRLEASAALSVLRAENEKLRAELESKEKYYEQMIDALSATDSADLAQMTACVYYKPGGLCRYGGDDPANVCVLGPCTHERTAEEVLADLARVTAERDAAIKKFEAEKEDFLDYALSGTQNAAPFCRNRHPDCVDKRGWCIPVKCHGFSRDKED